MTIRAITDALAMAGFCHVVFCEVAWIVAVLARRRIGLVAR